MYLKSSGLQPKYLLLLGDGSFDPKDRIEDNTNFVPTFQTQESLNQAASVVTDDYFGLLDEDEGYDASGILDVGIGRIPVKTAIEASGLVNKIVHYATSADTFGDWKNDVCVAADDADGNLHLSQADSLVYYMADYNVKKLYFDFYERVQTTEGYRYPEAKLILNQQIENGVFFVNYTGHGSYEGWASERVLEVEDIESWGNEDKLPLMIAATCGFSRFDDPAIVSGAEVAVLKNDGGAVSVLGCTRLGYSQANFAINLHLLDYMANPVEGENRLGDYLMNSKSTGSLSNRNFVLLGDPVLELAFPDYEVKTETVNGISITEPLDTIHPAEEITITGTIADKDENTVSGFSGALLVKVFERPMIKTTLGNQASSTIVDVPVQDSVLMEVQATITNGEFEYSFNLPSSMNVDFGKIKLSHYAFSDSEDANGYFSQIVVGGKPNAVGEHRLADESISFWPTLVSNQLNYSGKQNMENLKIEIFDLSGKMVFSKLQDKIIEGEQNEMDVSSLQNGMYLLRAYSYDKVNNMKFVKQ